MLLAFSLFRVGRQHRCCHSLDLSRSPDAEWRDNWLPTDISVPQKMDWTPELKTAPEGHNLPGRGLQSEGKRCFGRFRGMAVAANEELRGRRSCGAKSERPSSFGLERTDAPTWAIATKAFWANNLAGTIPLILPKAECVFVS
jgi:hypothetical protein